jgi:DNA-binding NarL/FixJ family response regulator
MKTRLVLADDHPVVLHGLQQMFEREPDFAVVASTQSGEAALKAVRTHRPDVLVIDVRMPDRSGMDVVRTLKDERIECRAVLFTATIPPDEIADAMRLGVRGVVLKESPYATLVDCVRAVTRGQTWFDTSAGRSKEPDEGLTSRELAIVRMIARGLRNRAIAEELSITEGTVKVHLHHIYEKLRVESRLELVLAAQRKGLA